MSLASLAGARIPHGDCFVEDFSEGLAPYATISGNPAVYSIGSGAYGTLLNSASQNAADPATIRRSIPVRALHSFRAKFQVTSLGPDDATLVGTLSPSLVGKCFFNPRREAFFDPLRRADIIVDGVHTVVSVGDLGANVWYEVGVDFHNGTNNTIVTITRLSDGVVMEVTALTSNRGDPVASIQFLNDSAGVTSATQYSDVEVC